MIQDWVSNKHLTSKQRETFCSGLATNNETGVIDPVHRHTNGEWWWYEETWIDEYGPFATREEATSSISKYAKEVLG